MDEQAVQFSDAIRERYTIERELGRGGMATVYLARDTRLDRSVALKVLNPELAISLSRERFKREVMFAARLQHPHILTVLDSGEAAGRLWFTMLFVEGESLRSRLQREKQLPIADALLITHQVASALDFAHAHGIIHRDIKPENILLIRDDVLIADFGIARALAEGAGHAHVHTITSPGSTVGTAAYMSPEQASGETYLDGRTDVYALGCVQYEMLAGEPPFTGRNAQAVIAKRFLNDVPSVRVLRPAVSEVMDAVMQHALAPVRADRFRTAGAFDRALEHAHERPSDPVPWSHDDAHIVAPRVTTTSTGPRTVRGAPDELDEPIALHRRWTVTGIVTFLAVLAIAAALALGWARILRPARAELAPAARTSSQMRVAVLPFDNIGDSTDAYFAEGVADALRGKLIALPGLQVTARTSSVQYRGSTKSPQQIGRELGVDYLIMGTVRWERGSGSDSRVQVSPELIQASNNAARWQQPFDAALTDVFRVQGDIAGRVATALGVALDARDRAVLSERPTTSMAAYDAYLRGQDVSDALGVTDPVTLRRAIGYYQDAVSLDTTFALAWSQLARAEAIVYLNGVPTPEQARAARLAAERARELAPGGATGYLALGSYYLALGRNADALRELDAGIRVAPSSAELLSQLSRAELSLGRYGSALTHLRQAQRVDPRSVSTARGLARTLLWLRDYPEALEASDRGLALAPDNLALLENKAMVYLARGDLAGARGVLRSAPASVDPAALAAYCANYWDLAWLLDRDQQKLVTTLPPAAFDGDMGQWAMTHSAAHTLLGDSSAGRVYADSAAAAYAQQLRAAPNDGQHRVLYGLALALAGRGTEGVREGEKAMRLLPPSRDAYVGAYTQHQMARIYLAAGLPERALDMLEPLLAMPYFLSPAWLRIDPTFAPLRQNERFRRLLLRS